MPVILLTKNLAAKCGLLAVLVLGWHTPGRAQPAVPPSTSASSTGAAVVSSVTWSVLSDVQKQALEPLSGTWGSLNEGQRRKWTAIAQNYPNLSADDQQKLHSRMVEWAALTPKDRALARLNFAQTKSVAKPERAANWEAYQALPPDERKNLASGAAAAPAGAALAPKPVSRDKLTPVPVTRRTPEDKKAAALPDTPLNRNTLLPQTPSDQNGAQRKATPGAQ